MGVLIGYDKPTGSEVYLECFYNDEGDQIIKALISCPDRHWSYNMGNLTPDEESILIDQSVAENDKYNIYRKYLPDDVIDGFEFF